MKPQDAITTLTEIFLKVPHWRPLLLGHKGHGKSETAQQVRANLERITQQTWGLVPLFLSQMADAGDLIGLPDKRDGFTHFAAPAMFPTREAVEQGRLPQRGILFLDEPNRAREELIAPIFQLLVTGEMGPHQLADGWVIMLAANPDTSDYMVRAVDDAFWDRVVVLRYENTVQDWLVYAKQRQFSPIVTGFVESHALSFQGNEEYFDLPVKPSFRSLNKVNEAVEKLTLPDHLLEEVIAGIIGRDLAAALMAYRKNHQERHLVAEDVLMHWGQHKAVWEKILASDRTDLRDATVESVLSTLKARNLNATQWPDEWDAEALYEWIAMMPRDLLIGVCNQLVDVMHQAEGRLVENFLLDLAGAKLLPTVAEILLGEGAAFYVAET